MLNHRLNESKIGTATVIVDILPGGKVIPNTKITPTSITIHNTGNIDAPAKNNHNYMKNCNRTGGRIASWHVTVGYDYIIQAQSFNYKTYHAGTTAGNNSSIGIEICMYSDKDKQKQAYDNAIALVKILMQYYNFSADKVKRHKDWSGKHCPAWLIEGKYGYTWTWFKSYLNGDASATDTYQVKVVNCTTLNARSGPSTNYPVKDTVKAGTILTIVGSSGNWLKTKSGLYVHKNYCKMI
jgi:N-acetylmuramoyl-L-alanine amidase CwlA